MAISTTLFLFLHTRDLHSKLKEMEVKLTNPEDLTSNQISGKCHTGSQCEQNMLRDRVNWDLRITGTVLAPEEHTAVGKL